MAIAISFGTGCSLLKEYTREDGVVTNPLSEALDIAAPITKGVGFSIPLPYTAAGGALLGSLLTSLAMFFRKRGAVSKISYAISTRNILKDEILTLIKSVPAHSSEELSQKIEKAFSDFDQIMGENT